MATQYKVVPDYDFVPSRKVYTRAKVVVKDLKTGEVKKVIPARSYRVPTRKTKYKTVKVKQKRMRTRTLWTPDGAKEEKTNSKDLWKTR